MAGLVPAIHAFAAPVKEDANARDICAKTRFALLPGHDEERGRAGLMRSRQFIMAGGVAFFAAHHMMNVI
jgi:hypothetical protein